LRLSGLPASSDEPWAGGAPFLAYCLGGEVRARQRRNAIQRARAAHGRPTERHENAYPTALILCQRLGVELEDVGRLVLAFEGLRGADAFAVLRDVRVKSLDDVFPRLAADAEALRAAVQLPTPEGTTELDPSLREALLEASDALAHRWFGHWGRAADGWQLLRRLAKALRHGAPLIPREVVVGPPGAGALGQGLHDAYERWVLLVDTEVDHEAESLTTTSSVADISDGTLARASQAGLEAVALARVLTAAHVRRVQSHSKWALPLDALKLVSRQQRRVLRKHAHG
jgi:hypothetical protein